MSSNDGDSTSTTSKKASGAQSSKSESTSKGEPTDAVETAASPEKPVDPYASEEEVAGSQLKTQKKETEEVVEQVVQQVAEEESDKTPSASEKTVDSNESNDKDVTEDAPKPQQPEEDKEVIKEVPLEAPPPPDTPLPPETPPPSEKVVDSYASAEDEVLEVQPKAQETEAKEAIQEEVVEEPLHESPPSKRVVNPYASTDEEDPETQAEIQQQEVEEVSTKNEQPIEEQKTVESRTNEDSRPVQPSIPKVISRQNSFESDSRAETKPATSKPPPPYHRQYDEWNSNHEDPWTAGASGIRFKHSKNNDSNRSKSASSGISSNDRTHRVDNGDWSDPNENADQYAPPVYHAKADENSNLSHHSNAENRSSNDVRSSYHGGEQTNFGSRRQDRVCYNCHQPYRYYPEQRTEQQNSWGTRQDNYCDSQDDYRRNQRDEFRGHLESNGPRDRNNAQNQSVSNRSSCIPVQRTVDQIFQDDQENDIDERTLYNSDGAITVMYGPDDISVVNDWDQVDLLPQVLENIKRANYVRPRNIQRYALPLIWQRYDLKAQAEAGSGKSAAFLVPIIDNLAREFDGKDQNERLHRVSALVIEPTRELAIQLFEQGRKLAHGTGVRVNLANGEHKLPMNIESLHRNGCDLLIAVPGRLTVLMKKKPSYLIRLNS
ncbi:RNA helicase [Aphelenchoides besseyi]|nr:RNA helicase [Aphelenchoides besseyi]